LIGDDDDNEPVPGQQPDGVEAAGQKPEFGPAFDVIWGIGVDDAVSVEENRLFDHIGA
jgi:hypothetical protein